MTKGASPTATMRSQDSTKFSVGGIHQNSQPRMPNSNSMSPRSSGQRQTAAPLPNNNNGNSMRGNTNSPAAVSNRQHNQHHSHRSGNDKQGAVTITLHTTKDDFDEKAEVKVELSNPDAVVEKMLNTLAHKFPPESVMTIATGPNISEESSTSGDSSSQGSASSSETGIGFSPVGDNLHKANRLSGRHYLGPNNEYYPELADSKGRPIAGYVRDPVTGGALPVGREVIGPNGRPIPGMIMGPNGKPIPGVPVPPEGLDEHGRPCPCYETVDGQYPREAISNDGRPLLGFAYDPYDGEIKRVGPAVIGPNGQPIKGMIRTPSGEVIPGIPLKPVRRPSQHSHSPSSSQNYPSNIPQQQQQQQPQQPFTPTSHPSDYPQYPQQPQFPQEYRPSQSGSGKRPHSNNSGSRHSTHLPNYTTLDGTRLPVAEDSNGEPMLGFARDPKDGQVKPVGPPFYDNNGHIVPGFITSPDGRRVPGIAIIIDEGAPSVSHGSHPGQQTPQQQHPTSPTHGHNYPHTSFPQGQTSFPQGQSTHTTYPTDTRQPPISPSMPSTPVVAVKIPAPSYPLIDGTYAPLAVGQDGRPMDGYGQDPKTGVILPVGRPFYNSKGQLVNGMIVGPDGNATPGLQLASHGWHQPSQQPLPIYLTADNQWAPMYVDPEGHLIHGWAKDPRDNQVKPVGLQAVDEHGRPIPGTIIGPDGRPAQGIPLSVVDDDNMTSASLNPPPNNTSTTTNYYPGTPTTNLPSTSGGDDDMIIRYVEVPVVEEIIKEVKKREVRENIKRVPKVEIVERIKDVNVPRIQYIDKQVEVPQIEHFTTEVKIRQLVDRPYEVLIHKPRIETKIVEQIKEVPGQIVEVPVIERHEQPVYVPRYIDKEVPTVVAQKLQPVIRQVSKVKKVPCTVTEPKIITVDVFIPKPVASTLGVGGKTGETHKTVDIPAAQFNALTRRLNISLDASHIEPLYVKEGAGIPILPAGERVETVEPRSTAWAASHRVGKVHCSNATEVPLIQVRETLGLSQHQHRTRSVEDTMSFTTREDYSFSDSSEDLTSDRHSRRHHKHHQHKHRAESKPRRRETRRHHHHHKH